MHANQDQNASLLLRSEEREGMSVENERSLGFRIIEKSISLNLYGKPRKIGGGSRTNFVKFGLWGILSKVTILNRARWLIVECAERSKKGKKNVLINSDFRSISLTPGGFFIR